MQTTDTETLHWQVSPVVALRDATLTEQRCILERVDTNRECDMLKMVGQVHLIQRMMCW